MKKLILATAIAAIAANSATAATVYEDKGLTFKIKGDWQIQLRDSANPDKKAHVEYDDLEIKNSVIYNLNDDMKAFGQLDFGFKDAAEGETVLNTTKNKNENKSADLEEAYIGLQIHNTKIAVGKMNLAGDEFGVEAAYETELEEDMFDADTSNGDDVVRIDAEFENAYLVLSHELEGEGTTGEGDAITDIFVSTDFEAVSVAAAYQTIEDTSETWGLSAAFDAGFAEFAADYSATDYDSNTEFDVSLTNLVAEFKANKQTKIALGYVNVDSDETDQDADTWYANVTYKFPAQKNVSLFAEVSSTDYDSGKETDTDVLAGMRIKF